MPEAGQGRLAASALVSCPPPRPLEYPWSGTERDRRRPARWRPTPARRPPQGMLDSVLFVYTV